MADIEGPDQLTDHELAELMVLAASLHEAVPNRDVTLEQFKVLLEMFREKLPVLKMIALIYELSNRRAEELRLSKAN